MLVLGAINVDYVVVAERLPGPGETVVGPQLAVHGGGKGANAAVAAARAGASVGFLGAVGRDDRAEVAERDLLDAGVNCDGVLRLGDHSTGAALIVVDAGGENQIAVGAGANLAMAPAPVAASLERWLPDTDCLLVSTEIPGEVVSAAVAAAARAGVTCVVNPAPPIPAIVTALNHGPWLTPNAGELTALLELLGVAPAGAAGPPAPARIEADARALQRRTGAPVVVTRGGDGALLLTADGAVAHVAPVAAQVRDSTGAGDTFNGVLAARLAAGDAPARAVRTANAAAALSVGAAGARAGMPTWDAILAALEASDRETP